MVSTFSELPARFQPVWRKKAASLGAGSQQEEEALFSERGAIFAEFGKVIVIGLGYVAVSAAGEEKLCVQSLTAADERELLLLFSQTLQRLPYGTQLCGHNLKEFDLPYLCRRLVVNGLSLPSALDLAGKKPWEVPHLDTMEMWKFGDRKSYTSLELLATLFDIPSSKSDIEGSRVHSCYYQGELERIAAYCRADVAVTAQLYRRLQGKPLLPDSAIQGIKTL